VSPYRCQPGPHPSMLRQGLPAGHPRHEPTASCRGGVQCCAHPHFFLLSPQLAGCVCASGGLPGRALCQRRKSQARGARHETHPPCSTASESSTRSSRPSNGSSLTPGGHEPKRLQSGGICIPERKDRRVRHRVAPPLPFPDCTRCFPDALALSYSISRYLVAWPDSRIAVGTTRHTGAGLHPPPTAAGLPAGRSEALRVAPGLTRAERREMRVGLRPLTRDTMPVRGPVPG
jgi:hypothetical protein